MQDFNWRPYKEAVERYGKELLNKIVEILRPHLPLFLDNRDLIPLAILLAGMLAPVAVGSIVIATDLLSKVTLFGLSATADAAKLTLAAAKMAVSVPVKLITKVRPLYWLTSPFRKGSSSQQLSQLMSHKWEQGQWRGRVDIDDRVFVGLQEKDKKGVLLMGSLPKEEKVGSLLPLVRKRLGRQWDSIQFICKGNLISMEQRLEHLPRNSSGMVQLEFLMLQAFG